MYDLLRNEKRRDANLQKGRQGQYGRTFSLRDYCGNPDEKCINKIAQVVSERAVKRTAPAQLLDTLTSINKQ